MSYANTAWAYRFKHVQPIEKFVLVTLGDRSGARGETGLPLIDLSELPRIAEDCNLPLDKFEPVLEQLMRRGVIRSAPGPSIELCTFIDPKDWNERKEKKPAAAAGNGNGRKK